MCPMFELDRSNRKNREVIKVVGVGGGGNNALNHMIKGGVEGVEFIAANTDRAHLEKIDATLRIELGKELTRGLGAGADPEVGMKAAIESTDELRAALEGADMVFIAAGMGGGTGTGASPVIAKIARETGTLVVAVVTRPFLFEGNKRSAYAADGILKLKEQVDALIVVPNERLLAQSDRRTSMIDAFKMSDGVLCQAVEGVTNLILLPGQVNVDFADVKKVLSGAGAAIMGIGEGSGENRVAVAMHNAIHSPLLETPMVDAKKVLYNITSGPNITIQEIAEAGEIIQNASDAGVLTIWGQSIDTEMDDGVTITVIAADFPENAAERANSQIISTTTTYPSQSGDRPSVVISSDAQRTQSRAPASAQQTDPAPQGWDSVGSEKFFSGVQSDAIDTPSYFRYQGKK